MIRWVAALLGLSIGMIACSASVDPSATPNPSPTAASCEASLPARTSPVDYPVAVLYAAGDDLPPVIGEVRWSGGAEPVATTAPRSVHLERFTVLPVVGVEAVSIRMTDGVLLDAWTIDAIPADAFRASGSEEGTPWAAGSSSTALICVPVVDGQWVVRGELTFADGEGRGTFYWRLNVSGLGEG